MEVMKNKQELQQEMQQNRNVMYTDVAAKWKGEREEKEHTDLRGSNFLKATSTGGKTESFLLLMQYTSGSPFFLYKASLPYIGRGQNKNNRINFHMDFGHSPTH